MPAQVWNRVKVLVLNYPNNPTGAQAPRGFLQRAIDLAHEYHFAIVQDFAYAGLGAVSYTHLKQTQAGQASLGIAHLVKQYANADRPVLNDISFDVPHGKVFVIVGPSGSGKSTLLRTIAGLEPIQGGTISLNGEVIETGKPGTESAGRSKRSSELRLSLIHI